MGKVAAAVPGYSDEVEGALLHSRNGAVVAAGVTDWDACNVLEAVLGDL